MTKSPEYISSSSYIDSDHPLPLFCLKQARQMDKIAVGLEADGILTGAGKERWHPSTIKKILTNEKYIGDALLQKTYTTDFLKTLQANMKTTISDKSIVFEDHFTVDFKSGITIDIEA